MLRGLTLSNLFCSWYIDELFDCSPVDDTEKARLNSFGVAMFYLKTFLPEDSCIPKRPTNIYDGAEGGAWLRLINNYSRIAEEGTVQFLEREEIRALWMDETSVSKRAQSKTDGRRRPVTRALKGGITKLKSISGEHFNKITCIDNVTPDCDYLVLQAPLVTKKKRSRKKDLDSQFTHLK
jgi:hypothetical protein